MTWDSVLACASCTREIDSEKPESFSSILAEQNNEGAVTRRYMTLETLAQISHPDDRPLQIAAE
jgi:hypothetical protein